MEMTWRQIYEYLDAEYRRALPALITQLEKGVTLGFRADEEYRCPSPDELLAATAGGAVDAACAEFAATGRWPLMSPTIARLIFDRVQAAHALAEFVCSPGQGRPDPQLSLASDKSGEETLHWLLVDYWHNAGMWREIYFGASDEATGEG